MRCFWERRCGGGARDLTILLLLVCKSVAKINMILNFLFQRGERWLSWFPPGYVPDEISQVLLKSTMAEVRFCCLHRKKLKSPNSRISVAPWEHSFWGGQRLKFSDDERISPTTPTAVNPLLMSCFSRYHNSQ